MLIYQQLCYQSEVLFANLELVSNVLNKEMNFLKELTNTSNNILTEIVCQEMPFTAAEPHCCWPVSQLSGITSFCIFIKEFKVLGRKVQLVETRSSGCLFPAMKPWGEEASFLFRLYGGRKDAFPFNIVSVGSQLQMGEGIQMGEGLEVHPHYANGKGLLLPLYY